MLLSTHQQQCHLIYSKEILIHNFYSSLVPLHKWVELTVIRCTKSIKKARQLSFCIIPAKVTDSHIGSIDTDLYVALVHRNAIFSRERRICQSQIKLITTRYRCESWEVLICIIKRNELLQHTFETKYTWAECTTYLEYTALQQHWGSEHTWVRWEGRQNYSLRH